MPRPLEQNEGVTPREISWGKRAEERLGWWVCGILGGISAWIAPGLVLFLTVRVVGLWSTSQALDLAGARWFPQEGIFGLAPLVVGTLSLAFLALVVALPLGVGTGIAIHFYCRGRLQQGAEAALAIVSGMPSVVFGLFGTFWFLPYLGPSLAAGALVLASMSVPTIALLSVAAFRQMPQGLIQEGNALGLSREQCIARLALPSSARALYAAASLALARCLGETLAVEMVCGNVAQFPTGLRSSVRTLTTTLVQEFEYASGTHAKALHLVALSVVMLAALAAGLALHTFGRSTTP